MSEPSSRSTSLALLVLLAAVAWLAPARSMAGVDLRLYTLDCGHATFKDMAQFSDTGEYDGKTGDIAVPCFLIRLPKTGTVILSGDLYHLRTNREFMRVPLGNANRAETLATMNRIETIVKNTKARLVVQHDPQDFQALPKFPGYLD